MEKEYYFFTIKDKIVFCHLKSIAQIKFLLDSLSAIDINTLKNSNYEYTMPLGDTVFFTVLSKEEADFTEIIGSVISKI